MRAMCVRARPLGDLRVAIATSQLCRICIVENNQLGIKVGYMVFTKSLFLPIVNIRSRPQSTSAIFRGEGNVGGGGSKLPTFADSKGLGVSRMPTSAIFEISRISPTESSKYYKIFHKNEVFILFSDKRTL